MGLKRYYTAFNRYKRSKGFGIHSPFAFNFVLKVLRERSPYYAYDRIEYLRFAAKSKLRDVRPHPRIISLKNAKLTFRIANYFNPPHILQIGTSYGVSSACMLEVSSASRLWLFEPNLHKYPVTAAILEEYMSRIKVFSSISECLAAYSTSTSSHPFILINDLHAEDYEAVFDYIKEVCASNGTIVMRNVSRSPLMRRLWFASRDCSTTGMTFSNEKFSVITASTKLPHQNFFLWF